MGQRFGGMRQGLFGFSRRLSVTVDFAQAAWNTVAKHEVLTVTGLVRLHVWFIGKQTLTSGGAATISFGDENNTARYSAAQTFANITSGVFVAPGGTVLATARWSADFAVGLYGDQLQYERDIGYEIFTAAMTGGQMEVVCFWEPISAGALVLPGAGAAL